MQWWQQLQFRPPHTVAAGSTIPSSVPSLAWISVARDWPPGSMAAGPAASRRGGRCHVSLGAPAATVEGVLFVNFIWRGSFWQFDCVGGLFRQKIGLPGNSKWASGNLRKCVNQCRSVLLSARVGPRFSSFKDCSVLTTEDGSSLDFVWS